MDYELSLAQHATNAEATDPADTDGALARAVSAGDRDAWARFYDRFFAWTYRFAYYQAGRNHADAEDLCSDILMIAARSIGRYDATRGSLDVWLFGIARHRLARFCRHRRMEVPYIPEIIDREPSLESDQEPMVDRVIRREELHRALASLPERQSTPLIGMYLEGRSTDELARVMESTPKAVEMLLRRARAALRLALETTEGGDRDERG